MEVIASSAVEADGGGDVASFAPVQSDSCGCHVWF